MDLQYFVELFCGGLTRGSIYALIALGYTMVYGIIELINFAHGEIYMIGAFTALIVASALGIMGFPAAGIIVMLPTILICVFFQTYILAGVAAGAVKNNFTEQGGPSCRQNSTGWKTRPYFR